MKKILFDLTACQPQSSSQYHGGGVYGEAVFNAILSYNLTVDISVLYNSDYYLNETLLEKFKRFNLKLFNIKDTNLSSIINHNAIDVFYSAVPSYYLAKSIPNCRFICTIHDLREIEVYSDKYELVYLSDIKSFLKFITKKIYPQLYINHRRRRYLNYLKNNSGDFVTITNHSKYSLLKTYPFLSEDKIKVFYSPSSLRDNTVIDTIEPVQQYFLLISGDRWIKNNLRAVLALDSYFSKNHNANKNVIITGVVNKKLYEKRIKNKEKFKYVGYVNTYELAKLYKQAYAFIFPSLNEGFGYPPLEAMAHRVPVLCSATSSLPEVLGDAVIYFNPYSISEIENRILQISNAEIHDLYAQKGFDKFHEVQKKQEEDLQNLVDFIISKVGPTQT